MVQPPFTEAHESFPAQAREFVLGDEGRGFYLVMANFQWERLVMALGAVGAMRRTLERAAVELRGRGQATRHRVAELATRAEAGTALTYPR